MNQCFAHGTMNTYAHVHHVQRFCRMRRSARSHRTLISCQWVFSVGDNVTTSHFRRYCVPPPAMVAGTTGIATTLHQGLGCRTKSGDALTIGGRQTNVIYILKADIGEESEGTFRKQARGSAEAPPLIKTKFALACGALATDSKLRRQQCHYCRSCISHYSRKELTMKIIFGLVVVPQVSGPFSIHMFSVLLTSRLSSAAFPLPAHVMKTHVRNLGQCHGRRRRFVPKMVTASNVNAFSKRYNQEPGGHLASTLQCQTCALAQPLGT